MSTRTGAILQQFCARLLCINHALLVWRSSVPGAHHYYLRMSPQKIGKQFSFPATRHSLPMMQQSSGMRAFPNFQLSTAVTVTLTACLHSRSSEVGCTLA